ncbi:inosine/guanosine kinase, partial [Enterobacter intestinihominis]
DITANPYQKTNVPNSIKHTFKWVTYSSVAVVCMYGYGVIYVVLNHNSPRLRGGLPEREDSVDEGFWDC